MNGKRPKTNRSINGKIESRKKNELMQQFNVTHWKQAILFLKTFGKIGRAGEPGIESNLRYIVVLFFHHFFCFFKPEFF